MLTKRTNGIPAYRRIQGAIRSVIEAGQLKPGDVVASERELARLHDVSLMTARHALASLEREASSSAVAALAPSSPLQKFTSIS